MSDKNGFSSLVTRHSSLLLDFDGRRLRGARPFAVFESKNGAWRWSANSAFPFCNGSGDVLGEIRRALRWSKARCSRQAGSTPRVRGAAIGFFSYDFARQLEPRAFTKNSPADELDLPDVRLVFCEELLVEKNSPDEARSTPSLGRGAPSEIAGVPAAYQNAIAQTQSYIARGDIYQANYAQRFSRALPCSPSQLYARLQKIHRAPFSALLEFEDFAIVSHSPERFLQLDHQGENQTLWAQPIKGTAPRGSTPSLDTALKNELQRSEKNRAENVMIVDLLRNDFGRVCEYGSVQVPQLFEIQTFPNLHHLVSTVTGKLRADCDALDAFAAAFPCGSITGAPKIRAMQIIDELETTRRGASFGAIGYFGFGAPSGSHGMEWNVAIRTITCKNGRAFFHAGGGIVEGSETQSEYEEMQLKAMALLSALENTSPTQT